MEAEGVSALVVLGPADCRYVTGFTGEAASVCVMPTETVLFTDARYTLQSQAQAPDTRLVVFPGGRDDLLPDVLRDGLQPAEAAKPVVGIDSTYLTVKRWDHLRPLMEEAGLEWRFVTQVVGTCRQVKDAGELDALSRSGALVVRAFEYLEALIVVGRTELEVALDLEMYLRRAGSEGVAFDFIIASGPRGAMPHAEPGNHVIEPGQLVVFDIGTVVDGYASDITRTYATGSLDRELVGAYQLVLRAQEAAIAAARAGLSCRELDSVARDILASGGLADLFVHSLGHGVGLEVHEDPTISQRSETTLEAGMTVTIEPGVYFPDRAGIRIEDTIIVHEDHAEVITPWPKELRFLR
jgi:Xaa-Pro aminopeptidase